MSETTYDEPDRSSAGSDEAQEGVEPEHRATLRWLEDEFPGWEIDIADSESWMNEELRPIWIARKDGHHPQGELSAAKLHTRLSEYIERRERREALEN